MIADMMLMFIIISNMMFTFLNHVIIAQHMRKNEVQQVT